MSKTWTLYKRELSEYFDSPIAYIAIVVFLALASLGGLRIFNAEAPRADLRPLFEYMPAILVIMAPALAMRLLSEEKGSGTFELLITMPVSDWQVVLGKFFAAVTVLSLAVAMTIPFPITVSSFGDLDWGVTFGAYAGLILMGACYLAVGLMTSSWARNQAIAFIIGFLICLLFYGLGTEQATNWMPDGLAKFSKSVFGLGSHFTSISKGVLELKDLVYYLSLAGIALTLTALSLESRKWR